MKWIRYYIACFIFVLISFTTSEISAQCSMCSLNAENSVKNGNTQGKGLNSGILYLLAAPYLAVALVGFIWYRNYRRKSIAIDIEDENSN